MKTEILKDLKVINFKQHQGHDGNGFNLDLIYKGKKIVHVFDDNWGGGYQYTTLGNIDTPQRKENGELFDELENRIKGLPKLKTEWGEMDEQLDFLVHDLVEKVLLKKDEKKGVVYHDKGQKHRINIWGWKTSIPTMIKKYGKDDITKDLQKTVNDLKNEEAVILNGEYLESLGINV